MAAAPIPLADLDCYRESVKDLEKIDRSEGRNSLNLARESQCRSQAKALIGN